MILSRAFTLAFGKDSSYKVDVLRLDKIHPLLSGNKWFKLSYYLNKIREEGKKEIITFGGPYSNHIHATAAACRYMNIKSIGIIRGGQPEKLSPTLQDAQSMGMELIFSSREDYRKFQKNEVLNLQFPDALIIREGGYGPEGALGAMKILEHTAHLSYSHILVSSGTGTTLAGLTCAANRDQKVIGITALKNNFSLKEEVEFLLPPDKFNHFELVFEYHFGGYAKYTSELLSFMNEWYNKTNIPTDFVYTGKLFFALKDLIRKKHFPTNSKILVIHSGGLQGNRSLPKGLLIF